MLREHIRLVVSRRAASPKSSIMRDRLQISVLGELKVAHDGRPLPLPASKKTRALLAYLAVVGRPVTRANLCDMFLGHAHARQPHHFHHGWLCRRAHLVARIRSSRWIVFWDAINAPISRPELIGSYKFWLRPVAGVRRTELHAQPERARIPSRRLICIGASRMLSSLQVLIRRARRSLGRAKAGRGMRRTLALVLAVIGTGAVAGSPPVPGARTPANQAVLEPIWAEAKWPFALDQWGVGRAFVCAPADCGTRIEILRATKDRLLQLRDRGVKRGPAGACRRTHQQLLSYRSRYRKGVRARHV